MKRMRISVWLLFAAVSAGCSGTHPLEHRPDEIRLAQADNELMIGPIRLTLMIEPAVVGRTNPFTVRLTVRNTAAAEAGWTRGSACLAFLNVYASDGIRVPLHGTDYACLAVVSHQVLAPGEVVIHTWALVAQTTDGSPLTPGEYVLEADPVVQGQHTLTQRLTIR